MNEVETNLSEALLEGTGGTFLMDNISLKLISPLSVSSTSLLSGNYSIVLLVFDSYPVNYFQFIRFYLFVRDLSNKEQEQRGIS